MGVLWAWVTGSGPSPAWIARVAKPLPCVPFAHDGQSRVGRRRRAAPRAAAPYPSGMDLTAWWTRLDARGAAAIAETWIPVGRTRVRRAGEGPLAVGARQALRERRLADRLCRPGTHRAVRRGHRGVRGVLSGLPARPARPRPVPGRAAAATSTTTASRTSTTSTYEQPHTAQNHYQDIAVRRVIAELVDDPDWPEVTDTEPGDADLVDLGIGRGPARPAGARVPGGSLVQIREPSSPGYALSPAVVPAHDPALLTTVPGRDGVVPRGGLRPPVGRGVLAVEQGHRGPLRPVPRAGATRARARSPGCDRTPTSGRGALLGALSLDIYVGRDLVAARRRRAQHGLAVAARRGAVPAAVARRRRPARGVPRVPRRATGSPPSRRSWRPARPRRSTS